jgi:hypothetical protein
MKMVEELMEMAECRNRDFCPPKLVFDGGSVAYWTI